MATEQGGRTDPARGLALLWGETGGRRGGLTAGKIVTAAIEVADAEGLGAVSMRRIATELGFATMSLYRHVPGKAELLDAMVDVVNAESPNVDDVPGGWRPKLELAAREEYALSHRHPWVLRIPWTRPALGPNSLAAFESVLRAVSDTGLGYPEMVQVVNSVFQYVRGAARNAVDGAEAERDTGVSDAQWWTDRAELFQRYFDETRFPTMTRAFGAGAFRTAPREGFEFGLARVLDGVAAFIDSRVTR